MKKEECVKQVFIPAVTIFVVLSFIPFFGVSQKDTSFAKGQTLKITPVSIGQVEVKAFIADTPPLRERGLGRTEGLAADEAMLFIFDKPARYGFWMKDMKFPIDIFWLDEMKHVVLVEENVLPSSYPETFTPATPVEYVLETRAGFARENEVKIGTPVSF